jgi:hypothetical protein
MPKKITASIRPQQEGYSYEAPWMFGSRMGKSFILTRNGFLLHLPVKHCPVQLVDDDKVEVEIPDWLYHKNKSFFT